MNPNIAISLTHTMINMILLRQPFDEPSARALRAEPQDKAQYKLTNYSPAPAGSPDPAA